MTPERWRYLSHSRYLTPEETAEFIAECNARRAQFYAQQSLPGPASNPRNDPGYAARQEAIVEMMETD